MPTTPNSDGSGYNITTSEFGHLFNIELGAVANQSIVISHNDNYGLFSNVHGSGYWSSRDDVNAGWAFYTQFNAQYSYPKNLNFFALAVRTGDVAAVPVPAAIWLFGSGLLGLLGLKRRNTIS